MQEQLPYFEPADEASDLRPLVVDIPDLVSTNWSDERRLASLRCAPWTLLRTVSGRLSAAADIADEALRDEIAHWPTRGGAVEELAAQARRGRQVVLVTAAPRSIATAVAARFDFISEVVADAPDDGGAIDHFLAERYHAGYDRFDDGLAPSRPFRIVAEVDGPLTVYRTAAAWMAESKPARKALRLHQWAKNLLIFIPLVLGGKVGDPAAWLSALVGFMALGLVASATYIVNDLIDLPSDRQHWTKRDRPLASGKLSIREAVLIAIVLMSIGLALAITQTWSAVAVLMAYVAMTLAYSAYFKRVPIVDVFLLASLFTMRLALGIALTDVHLSPWLLVFSMFVFLSLSVAKRHTEILRMIDRKRTSTPGRGYVTEDAPLTLALGLASAMAAVLIMVVYLVEDAVPRQIYKAPQLLWTIPPILHLFLGRIWLLSQRGQLHDDPVAFALKDPVSLGYGFAMVLALTLALTGVGWS